MDLDHQWTPTTEPLLDGPVRVEYSLGGRRREADVADISEVPFETCDPVRTFVGWRGKRNYEGEHWMATMSRLVPYESLTERACLIELDRLADVAAVSSQPMRVRWLGMPQVSHTPDFFVRRADGRAIVVDVRPSERIDADARAKFDRTTRRCERLGWRYMVYDRSGGVREKNLRFLMRFRDSRWSAVGARVPRGEMSLAELAQRLGGGDRGLARSYALLWYGGAVADLDEPLSMRSKVVLQEA